MADSIVYLNGEYLPRDEARVSVLDRGFLFGDGVYEVIPVFGGKLMRIDEHLERLQRSLDRVSLQSPLSSDDLKSVFEQLLQQNPGNDRSVYLQITRGVLPVRDLSLGATPTPTIFAMVNEIKPVDPVRLEQGIDAITIADFRWKACDIKSISLIANVMLRLQANQENATDAIMVRDGVVTEGTASNIFIVRDGVLVTPPKSDCLLPGITRDLVIELARKHDIEVQERDINEDELMQADEVWLTSSTREIAPVVSINKQTVGEGIAGPVWRKVLAIYQGYKQELRHA